MQRGVAVLLVLVTAIPACSEDDEPSKADNAEAAPEVVVEELAPTDVPDCTADQVHLGTMSGADAASIAPRQVVAPEDRVVVLTAEGRDQPCGLSAWPAIGLTTDAGESEVIVPEPDPDASPEPPGGRVVLLGGRTIAAIVRLRSWCVASDADVLVELRLPLGHEMRESLRSFPPACDPGVQNVAGTWFVVAPTPDEPLVVTVGDFPEQVASDGPLRFTVRVDNISSEPVGLDPCPSYRVTAQPEAGNETDTRGSSNSYELDCSRAPDEIPAGGQLHFAAEMPVSDFPGGFPGGLQVEVLLDHDNETWTIVAPPTVALA